MKKIQIRMILLGLIFGWAAVRAWNVLEELEPLASGSFRSPAVICDAGSTGTRVYAFYIPIRNQLDEYVPVVEPLGRTERGMSEHATLGLFHNATLDVLPFLQKGIKRLGPKVPVYIFATGGVRSLDSRIRDKLWTSLRNDLEEALVDMHYGELTLRVVKGADEALYGLIASNYLVGGLSLANGVLPLLSPVGVLDLGGSSLELALVGDDMRPGTEDDLLVSFRSLGMYQFRQLVEKIDSSAYCKFDTGRGDECRKIIHEALIADHEFIHMLDSLNLKFTKKFIGISAFAYAMDFTDWILKLKLPHALNDFVAEFPNPTVTSIRQACDAICSLPHLESLFQQHRFTSARESSGRCYDCAFIAEALSLILGDRMDERIVFFVFEARGIELEWTLGYYIKHHVFLEPVRDDSAKIANPVTSSDHSEL